MRRRADRDLPPPRSPRPADEVGRALLHAGAVHARGAAHAQRTSCSPPTSCASATSARSSSAATGRWGCPRSTCEVTVSIAAWQWGAYLGEESKLTGIQAKVSSWRGSPATALIPHAKASGSTSTACWPRSRPPRPAIRRRSCSTRTGFVCEGSGENIYAVRDGQILTPPQRRAPRRDQPQRSCIARSRLRGGRAQYGPRRADLANEVCMSGDHRRARPGARDRRSHDRQRLRRGSDHAGAAACPRRRPARARAALRRALTSVEVPDKGDALGIPTDGSTTPRPAPRPPPSPAISRIELYDTTLRDGMQGKGESLSAPEKVRVAHRLDELGIDLIEAGFRARIRRSSSFRLLAASVRARRVAAFGRTRRRGVAADRTRRCGCWPVLRPVCTVVGKTWTLHLEKVVKVDRDENLRMIASRSGSWSARASGYLRRRALLRRFRRRPPYALRCLRPSPRPAPTPSSAATPTAERSPTDRRRDDQGRGRAGAGGAQIGIHCHDDAGCGVANSLAAVTRAPPRPGNINGYGERCGNANLITIIPNLQRSSATVPVRRSARGLTRRALLRRAAQLHARSRRAYVGRNALRTRAACTWPASGPTRRRSSTSNRDRRQTERVLMSELSGKGTVHSRAREAGIELDDPPPLAADRARQGARARRVSL